MPMGHSVSYLGTGTTVSINIGTANEMGTRYQHATDTLYNHAGVPIDQVITGYSYHVTAYVFSMTSLEM